MDGIFVKKVKSEFENYFIIFEHGKIETPICVLPEYKARKLSEDIGRELRAKS